MSNLLIPFVVVIIVLFSASPISILKPVPFCKLVMAVVGHVFDILVSSGIAAGKQCLGSCQEVIGLVKVDAFQSCLSSKDSHKSTGLFDEKNATVQLELYSHKQITFPCHYL